MEHDFPTNGAHGPPAAAVPLDPDEVWASLTPTEQLGLVLSEFRPEEWLTEPALSVLAAARAEPLRWARIALRWQELSFVPLSVLTEAIDAWRTALGGLPVETKRGRGRPKLPPPPLPPGLDSLPDGLWKTKLQCLKSGEPRQNVSNIWLLLAEASPWASEFWLDAVRGKPMV